MIASGILLASFLNSYTADAGMQDEDVYLYRTQLQLGKGTSYRTVLIHVVHIYCYCFKKVRVLLSFISWQ